MASAALKIVTDPLENKIDASVEYGFEEFWAIYYRKEARKDAMKAWAQVVPASKAVDVIVACAEWRRVWQARGETRYCPLAGSWLRGERWEDEIPAEFKQVHRPAAQAEFKPREVEARSVMPDNVRDLIAKFKGTK